MVITFSDGLKFTGKVYRTCQAFAAGVEFSRQADPDMNSVGVMESNPQVSFRNQTDGVAQVVLRMFDRN